MVTDSSFMDDNGTQTGRQGSDNTKTTGDSAVRRVTTRLAVDRAVGGGSTLWVRAVGGGSTSWVRAGGGGSTTWVRAVPHRSPNVSRWAVMGGPFRADAQVMGAVAIRTALVLGVGPPALKEPQRVRGENLRLSSLHNFSTL